jgi:hypothetical protein
VCAGSGVLVALGCYRRQRFGGLLAEVRQPVADIEAGERDAVPVGDVVVVGVRVGAVGHAAHDDVPKSHETWRKVTSS